MTRKLLCIKSSTSVYRRIFECGEQVSHIETLLRRWSSGVHLHVYLATDLISSQILPSFTCYFIRGRLYMARRCSVRLRADIQRCRYCERRVADGNYQGFHQDSRDGEPILRPCRLILAYVIQLFALEHMRDRYWHNMASRIQRAWRNYLRHKEECVSRIQRFWKDKKDGLAFYQLRDYSHQVLAGRKERRRYSLVSMRQFRGDYLEVGMDSPQGDMIRGACGIPRE